LFIIYSQQRSALQVNLNSLTVEADRISAAATASYVAPAFGHNFGVFPFAVEP